MFDGAGHNIYQAFRHKGSGSFERCHFRNISYPGYKGFGVVAFGGAVNLTDCSFFNIGRVGVLYFGSGVTGSIVSGTTYQGKGSGDRLDYGIELGSGASATIQDGTFKNCLGITGDGSYSAGVLVTTYYGGGTFAEIKGNTFENNEHGIHLGVGSTSGADTSVVNVSFNYFFDSSPGVKTYTTSSINVENNWWGCNGGPNDLDNCGETIAGDPLPGVDFDPWLVMTMVVNPDEIAVGADATVTVDLKHNSDGVDVSPQGSVPDGRWVLFQADGVSGDISTPSAELTGGEVVATYHGSVLGPGWVRSTLDSETLGKDIGVGITINVFADGFESGHTDQWDRVFPAPVKLPIGNPLDYDRETFIE